MASKARLNDRQLMVLRRVGSGEPVTSHEPDLAVTVYALRGRGLVTTPRQDGIWTAQITDAGRYYLEHGRYPQQPDRPTSSRRPSTAPETVSAEELITQVREAGGTLRVPAPDEQTRRAWRQAIHAAKSTGRVPEGYHLRHTGRNKGDLIVRLVQGDHPTARYRGKHPIPIPNDLAQRHAAIAAVSEDEAVRAMSRSVRRRVLLILQAIAAEAERREYEIRYPGDGGAQLRLIAGDLGCTVTVTELAESRPRKLTAEEIKAKKLYPWQRIPQEYVQTPTGQLEIEADCGFSGKLRRHDGQRWRIEDKLWDVFATIERAAELRARQRAEQDKHAAQEERRRAERRERWEHAMAEARRCALEDQRVQALNDQLASWQRARSVRAYADAIEDRLRRAAAKAAEAAEATAEWIAWMRVYADRIDPVRRFPEVPDEAAIGVDDLRPYLGGFSPDGPDY